MYVGSQTVFGLMGCTKLSDNENIVSAFSEEQAARLVGLSRARIRGWDKQGFFSPTFRKEEDQGVFGRIYSFNDVVCLRTLAILVLDHKIPVAELKDTQRKLFNMDQTRWGSETLYVLGKRVYFALPDGDGHQEATSTQLALQNIPLHEVRREMRNAVRNLSERAEDSFGKITSIRGVRGSRPTFEGTRIPVQTIKDYLDEGVSFDDIIKEYPQLTIDDIIAAKTYLGISAA